MATRRRQLLHGVAARTALVIRIDAVWLAVEPLDMRAGTETALARVIKVFGEARTHHAYLFANRRATRMKVLVHDGFGIWLCARRLHRGSFTWAMAASGTAVSLTREQLRALVIGLPWHRLDEAFSIRVA
jgi:transposase